MCLVFTHYKEVAILIGIEGNVTLLEPSRSKGVPPLLQDGQSGSQKEVHK